MRTSIAVFVGILGLWVGHPLPGQVSNQSSGRDLRSVELIRFDCANTRGSVETVLFANGTVRVRTGASEDISLGEMTLEEVEIYVDRLEEYDLREVETRYRRGIVGDGVDVCELVLDLDGDGGSLPIYFTVSPYDAYAAPLGSVLDIVSELGGKVSPASTARLPRNYEARLGDILRAADGSEYRIVAPTGDDVGFELVHLSQPLTIFVSREDLAGRFVAVVSRRGGL